MIDHLSEPPSRRSPLRSVGRSPGQRRASRGRQRWRL